MIVVQEMFASPPLPSLHADKEHHLSLQVAHIKAKAEGRALEDGADIGSYSSSTKGHGFALGFTSPSIGHFSYFMFGNYSSIEGDYVANMTDKSKLSLNGINSKSFAGGGGLNYIFLGSEKTPLALSLFGGGLYFTLKSKYTSVIETSSKTTSTEQEIINRNFGPFIGMQFKIRMGWLGITPYSYLYSDLTNHCAKFNGNCEAYLDNSFAVVGVKVSIAKFSISAYTNIFRKLPDDDTDTTMLQLGYTIDF